ncbi:TDRD6 protein, partial [Atractosteus spatula]|nr:TDRD6 protein [Atractosteus spatula]
LCGFCIFFTMYSIPGLPTPGSNITVHITRVNLNPLCVLVELWGSFDQESKLEYQRMRADIQFPKERFSGVEGNPGDLCLVQILETWYRARIVSRHGKDYDVFLIDEGKTLAVNFYNLAWGQKDLFLLPPEVEFCVLANILPLSPENKWSPVALEFLSSLRGRRFEGYVQDVLIPHRTFLLDIPSISKQMYEMGFAKKLSSEMFKFFVERSLKSLTGAVAIPENKLFSSDKGKDQTESTAPHRAELIQSTQVYFYPQIQAETVETVIITELVHPSRFFCQLRVFSQELKRMTKQITQHYEGRSGIGKIKSEALGSACAARGSDGKWYRSVLQQVFPCKNVVEVLHVDYGMKECVPIGSLRSLAPEFFRMPVVTYACSMLGISDQGAGWSTSQVKYLKSLLLNQVVIAKFEYQNYSEGVYYVTLYGDENVNINNLFGMREKCLLEVQKSPGEYAICKTVSPKSLASLGKRGQVDCLVPKTLVEGRQAKSAAGKLKVNASCEAVVEFVVDPSEFWIRKHEYSVEFDQLMNSISNLYDNAPEMEGIVRTPTVGLYCVAKSKDSSFYRAVVNEVLGQQVKVYFVDYGNTEIVDWHNLKVLPSKYQELPALALKCCLSGIYPKDDKWSRNAIIFFTKAVADKVLEVCVSAKLPDRYAVHLTSALADGEQSINKLLCSAGYAECWDFKKPVSKQGRVPLPGPKVQSSTEKNSHLDAAKDYSCPFKPVFKEHLFPIGSSVGVKVSHIESPNDFWCQIYKNLSSLNLMMRDIQSHCSTSPELYQPSETACIARCPENGLWYRALVIKKHSSLEVDVLYIDYGKMERVFIKDLRAINPLFLQMEGQAFRCSLYNLIQAFGHDPLNWSDAAKSGFQDFVDIADSTGLDLKCTIYAVMYDSSKVVFNVVDLETPFQSVCSLLVQKGLAQRAPLKKAPQPPFHLDTYYYSSHDIKIGGEEEVFVTYVKTVGNFYCHLGKNFDIVEQLAEKVNYLCQQLDCTGCPQTFGTVCFAKYSDGKWYRGQIKSYIPTIQVYFVDYGDTQEVDKSDLLPIPIEASELMSVPVQAVACGLSDIAADVPAYVNVWFENVVIGNSFRAVVVSKEPCGKLMVDLYDGKMQLTSKLKETFPGETSTKENISLEVHDDPSAEILPSRYKSCDISEGQTLEVYASSLVSPEYFWCQFADSDSLQIIAELADETGNSVDASAKFIEDLFPGSPCLALFKDDEHWYRAEVKSKTQDVLSIRFVDYGNEVEVDHDSVRPVPSELLEIPTQAFLCLLEGFDHSCGSWDIGAIDKFYELLADQPLEVTILKCEKPEIDEPSLFNVKVQCNGQLITDVMRNYWKGFVAGSDDEMVDLEQELPQLESTEILQHEDVIELKLAVQRTVTDFLSLQGEVEMNAEQSTSPTNIPDEYYLKYKTEVITELQEVEEVTEGALQQPNVQLNFQYEQNLESGEEKCVELAWQISASGHQETVFDEGLEFRTPTSTNGEPERGQCLLKESNEEKNEVFTNMVEDATDNACLKTEEMVCDVDADADLKLVALCDPTVELSENGTLIVNKPVQDLPYNYPLENNPDNLTEGLDQHNAGVPSSQEENGREKAAKLGLGDFKDLAMAACSIELVEDVKTFYAENQNHKPLETLSTSSLTECPSYKLGEPADESFDELLDSQEDLCFDEQLEGSDIYEEVFKQCQTDPLSTNPTDLKEAEDFPTEMEVHRVQNVEPRTEPG